MQGFSSRDLVVFRQCGDEMRALVGQKKLNGFRTLSRSEEVATMSAAGEQYVVDEHGNRVAIILPLREYEQLQEDLHDLAVVAERREEPNIGFDEFRKRYER